MFTFILGFGAGCAAMYFFGDYLRAKIDAAVTLFRK